MNCAPKWLSPIKCLLFMPKDGIGEYEQRILNGTEGGFTRPIQAMMFSEGYFIWMASWFREGLCPNFTIDYESRFIPNLYLNEKRFRFQDSSPTLIIEDHIEGTVTKVANMMMLMGTTVKRSEQKSKKNLRQLKGLYKSVNCPHYDSRLAFRPLWSLIRTLEHHFEIRQAKSKRLYKLRRK